MSSATKKSRKRSLTAEVDQENDQNVSNSQSEIKKLKLAKPEVLAKLEVPKIFGDVDVSIN